MQTDGLSDDIKFEKQRDKVGLKNHNGQFYFGQYQVQSSGVVGGLIQMVKEINPLSPYSREKIAEAAGLQTDQIATDLTEINEQTQLTYFPSIERRKLVAETTDNPNIINQLYCEIKYSQKIETEEKFLILRSLAKNPNLSTKDIANITDRVNFYLLMNTVDAFKIFHIDEINRELLRSIILNCAKLYNDDDRFKKLISKVDVIVLTVDELDLIVDNVKNRIDENFPHQQDIIYFCLSYKNISSTSLEKIYLYYIELLKNSYNDPVVTETIILRIYQIYEKPNASTELLNIINTFYRDPEIQQIIKKYHFGFQMDLIEAPVSHPNTNPEFFSTEEVQTQIEEIKEIFNKCKRKRDTQDHRDELQKSIVYINSPSIPINIKLELLNLFPYDLLFSETQLLNKTQLIEAIYKNAHIIDNPKALSYVIKNLTKEKLNNGKQVILDDDLEHICSILAKHPNLNLDSNGNFLFDKKTLNITLTLDNLKKVILEIFQSNVELEEFKQILTLHDEYAYDIICTYLDYNTLDTTDLDFINKYTTETLPIGDDELRDERPWRNFKRRFDSHQRKNIDEKIIKQPQTDSDLSKGTIQVLFEIYKNISLDDWSKFKTLIQNPNCPTNIFINIINNQFINEIGTGNIENEKIILALITNNPKLNSKEKRSLIKRVADKMVESRANSDRQFEIYQNIDPTYITTEVIKKLLNHKNADILVYKWWQMFYTNSDNSSMVHYLKFKYDNFLKLVESIEELEIYGKLAKTIISQIIPGGENSIKMVPAEQIQYIIHNVFSLENPNSFASTIIDVRDFITNSDPGFSLKNSLQLKTLQEIGYEYTPLLSIRTFMIKVSDPDLILDMIDTSTESYFWKKDGDEIKFDILKENYTYLVANLVEIAKKLQEYLSLINRKYLKYQEDLEKKQVETDFEKALAELLEESVFRDDHENYEQTLNLLKSVDDADDFREKNGLDEIAQFNSTTVITNLSDTVKQTPTNDQRFNAVISKFDEHTATEKLIREITLLFANLSDYSVLKRQKRIENKDRENQVLDEMETVFQKVNAIYTDKIRSTLKTIDNSENSDKNKLEISLEDTQRLLELMKVSLELCKLYQKKFNSHEDFDESGIIQQKLNNDIAKLQIFVSAIEKSLNN